MLSEMKTFIWHNGRPQAMRSYNDDLIMSCAVGCWVRDTALSANQREMEYQKAFIGAITKQTSNIDTRIRGQVDRKNLSFNERASQHASTVQNFPWLFKG